jgi:hypothetical protein
MVGWLGHYAWTKKELINIHVVVIIAIDSKGN